MEKNFNKIKKVIKNFFSKLGYSANPSLKEERSEDSLWINIEIDEPGMLIGKSGQNLADIQHLLRILINKKLGEFIYLTIDINDYKYSQIDQATNEAQKAIEKVLETKEVVVLEPMNPFKRKIIHMEIRSNPKLTSRSVGEEPNRRIMIELN